MKRQINFPKIMDFTTIVKDIQHAAQYTGECNDAGKPIYDKLKELPTVDMEGTEKIHGSNGAVSMSNPDGLWVQNRTSIITIEKDNYGCAFLVEKHKNIWQFLINQLSLEHKIDLNENIITIYFEFCGGKIQKKSAVNGLDKRMVIFKYFKVSPLIHNDALEEGDEGVNSYWLPTTISGMVDLGNNEDIAWVDYPSCNIFNVMNFKTWKTTIHFEHAEMHIKELIAMVELEVEAESPIGVAMDAPGNIGEGIVWEFWHEGNLYRFKVKGDKHSSTTVKILDPADEEMARAKVAFANKVCHAGRLEQAWQKTFGIDNEKMEPTKLVTGDFIRLVIKDIMEEEMNLMMEMGVEPRDVNAYVSKISQRWFIEQVTNYQLGIGF